MPLTETEKNEFFDACENGLVGVIERALKKCPEAVEWRNPDGWTPLSLAVQWAQNDAVECLLEHGANWEAVDKGGVTVQHLSELLHYESITDLFRDAAAKREREAEHRVHVAEVEKFSSGLESPISLPRQTLRLHKPGE